MYALYTHRLSIVVNKQHTIKKSSIKTTHTLYILHTQQTRVANKPQGFNHKLPIHTYPRVRALPTHTTLSIVVNKPQRYIEYFLGYNPD